MSSKKKSVASKKPASSSNGKGTHVAPKRVAPTAAPDPRMGKLPIAVRVKRQIALAAKRWGNLTRVTKGWSPEMDIAMGEVGDSITSLSTVLKAVDDDFKPARKGGAPKKQIDVDSIVNVTDKALKHYDEVIAAKDLKGLRVKRIAGKKVVCVDTATGFLYASSTGIDCSN